MSFIRNGVAGAALATAMVYVVTPVASASEGGEKLRFDLSAQPLSTALLALGEAARRQIIFPGDDMKGLSSKALHGAFTEEAALDRLLSGTGFVAQREGEVIFIRGRSEAASTLTDAPDAGERIVVTGSRIRGAISSSPVFSYESAKLREQGISDMTAMAAAIPQNFMGGQSPAIGSGAEGRGSLSGNGSTSLNLRGLGPEATLTLVNGHRMAYSQNLNAVDFSSVPFAAVERIEVMPDGASAIYGSDAIGGVANIILKRDFEGLWANASIGGATSGGYLTQRYGVVTGRRWSGGGGMLTASYDRNTRLLAKDRDFASSVNPEVQLFPEMHTISLVGNGHQDLDDRISLNVDAAYSRRIMHSGSPYTLALPLRESGSLSRAASDSLNIAPSITMALRRWTLSLTGVYGKTRSDFDNRFFPTGGSRAIHDNEMMMAEFAAEGPLVTLPSGDVRLAIGTGYKHEKLISALPGATTGGTQNNSFAYGELNIPLVDPSQHIWGIHRASFDGAVRYEHYGSGWNVAVPRIGVSLAPTPDFDLKGSWGRSFRVPTLFQRLYAPYVQLYPSSYWPATVVPQGKTVLYLAGGNPDLNPEKARSLSGTVAIHPRAVHGLDISASYFNVLYKDRIITPMLSLSSMLANPIYGSFVERAPAADQIASVIAMSPTGLEDYSGSGKAFDPALVHAILDNRYHNVARNRVRGVDLSASYRLETQTHGSFTLQGGLTYIDAERTLVPGAAASKVAGRIFTPAHYRGRGSVAWTDGTLNINAVISHAGSVIDDRTPPFVKVQGMTVADLTAGRRFGGEQGFDLQISLLNLFNAIPDVIAATGQRQPYDFTNYSPIGRQVSFSLTKAW